MMQRLWLVDAPIYFFKAYFGPAPDPLKQFARWALQLRKQAKDDGVLVAWDHSLFSGYRHRLCDQYKANRVLPDDALADDMAIAERLMVALGFNCVASKEYEADDLLATGAKWARARQIPVNVISRDKDLGQLILAPNDVMWDFPRGDKLYMSDIEDYFGVPATEIADLLALAGDKADNIEGIAGVGNKTAVQLINYLGSVEQIMARKGDISELPIRGAKSLAVKVEENEEAAKLAKALTLLSDDVQLGLTESTLTVRPSDIDELAALEQILSLELLLKAR